MQLFSADATIFSKQLNLFFVHENIKNGPQKLLIIGPKSMALRPNGPAAQTSPELIFYIINMSQDTSVSLPLGSQQLTAAKYMSLSRKTLAIDSIIFAERMQSASQGA